MGKHTFVPTTRDVLTSEAIVDAFNSTHPAGKKQVPVVPFDEMVYKYFGDSADLLLRKHRDYGPKNISLAPGGPLNGLRVRMWDKTARINNLMDNASDPQNESLKDSFQDLANYAIIAMMVLDGKWPEK